MWFVPLLRSLHLRNLLIVKFNPSFALNGVEWWFWVRRIRIPLIPKVIVKRR
ncbi:MAG: hypothetical protein ACTS4X_00855 [Candidatus Hodgkinia cicadicola]